LLIGVLSDSHRYTWVVEKAVKALRDYDIIIHLGDNVQDVREITRHYKGRIIYVKGNCDFSPTIPSELVETIDGKKIFITHGHLYDVKYDLMKLRYRAMELNADIVLYGHTHISSIEYMDGIWFINPGSLALPRNGLNSLATIEIKDGNVNGSIMSV
jgi:uncharacterized protein